MTVSIRRLLRNTELMFVLLIATIAMIFSQDSIAQEIPPKASTVRFATFNVSFNRKEEGRLKQELEQAKTINPKRIAEIIQRVRPDIVLLNEFDFDAAGEAVSHFSQKLLGVSQNGQKPIKYEHVYLGPVNTGVDSGLDLNKDEKTSTPNDAFGFGAFPGQYGMVILSRYEIDRDQVRTFQKFLWKDMPDCLWPVDPKNNQPYYNDDVKKVFRLSSKSHWDVPIKIDGQTIHFLVCHPTPPVFDAEEDRNGCRNHDEIRFFADYVTPNQSDYIYDDLGNKGGLPSGSHFVIAGDMNADECDGDTTDGAAKLLTTHALINHEKTPRSAGGSYFSSEQGRVNVEHKGDPAFDTGDFNDFKVGNMHIDYCLPSKTLTIKESGIFWPTPDQPGADLVKASDHRMVWIDLEKPSDK